MIKVSLMQRQILKRRYKIQSCYDLLQLALHIKTEETLMLLFPEFWCLLLFTGVMCLTLVCKAERWAAEVNLSTLLLWLLHLFVNNRTQLQCVLKTYSVYHFGTFQAFIARLSTSLTRRYI